MVMNRRNYHFAYQIGALWVNAIWHCTQDLNPGVALLVENQRLLGQVSSSSLGFHLADTSKHSPTSASRTGTAITVFKRPARPRHEGCCPTSCPDRRRRFLLLESTHLH